MTLVSRNSNWLYHEPALPGRHPTIDALSAMCVTYGAASTGDPPAPHPRPCRARPPARPGKPSPLRAPCWREGLFLHCTTRNAVE
jgi:hypothetical protein